jgi:cytochrome P450
MPDAIQENFYARIRESIDNPYPVYRRYREADPVHRATNRRADQEDEFVVFRYDDVAAVLASRNFGRRAAVGHRGPGPAPPLIPPAYPRLAQIVDNWLVFMDPPRHGQLRALIADRFAARLSGEGEGLRGLVSDVAGELASGIGKSPAIEVVGEFAAPLPMLVILEVLGVPRAERAWLRECALALQDASSFRGGNRAERLARAEAAAGRLDDYFRAEVRARRRGEKHDLIGELVGADPDGELLTDDVLVGTCVHLLTAGHEPTTGLVGKAVLALLERRDVLDQLRRRPEMLAPAVDELVRYDAPVQMVTRWAYRDEQIGGRDIARGDKVTLVLGSANRDPRRFEDPDTIKIDRRDRRHCGFGMGIHYCLGSSLGRMEAEIGIRSLLDALSDCELGDEPIHYADDVVFHGPRRLVLRTRASTKAAKGC